MKAWKLTEKGMKKEVEINKKKNEGKEVNVKIVRWGVKELIRVIKSYEKNRMNDRAKECKEK